MVLDKLSQLAHEGNTLFSHLYSDIDYSDTEIYVLAAVAGVAAVVGLSIDYFCRVRKAQAIYNEKLRKESEQLKDQQEKQNCIDFFSRRGRRKRQKPVYVPDHEDVHG